ncbi:hypothetical protein [Fusobacterium sp.]|uniref:hypothetical protein n=1 Tax=Fusobacterium sp. TaxID=68766 RepID=UPI0029008521|nr:hypothetical protein [Fusobacterium sp.]MDU1910701.1 hypothetical protein [Fusobacterium sp.]
MDITSKNTQNNIDTIKIRLFPDDSLNKDAVDEKIKDIIEDNKEEILFENEDFTEDEKIVSIDNKISDEIVSVNKDIIEDEKIISTDDNISDEAVSVNNISKENTDPRHVIISADNSSFESGLEIKYTSLQLRNFPIKYKNFSEKMDFDEIVNIGTTSIKIGNTVIHNVLLKILVYGKFKLLEIKTREFKLALSIELNDKQTLVKKDDYFKYNIYDKVKTSRLSEVAELFKKVFAGENITFKYNQLIGDISFENRLEVYKFTIISETINSYKFITKELELYKEKNINEVKDTFYTLFLLNSYLKNEKLSNWVNFRIKNNYNILSGDILSFEKTHKLHLHGINFDLKEHVKLMEPVSSREINEKNEICCYRKAVEITLEKIKKI